MRHDQNAKALSTTHLENGLKGRILRGGIVNFVSQCLSILLQLLCAAVLARLILPADYGLLAMAGTAIALASMLNSLGLTTPTIQRAQINSEQVATLFYLSIMGGAVLYLITILLSPMFAGLFHDRRVILVMVISGLSIPISAATAQFNAIFIRNMLWTTLQIINLSSQILGALTAIMLAWLAGWGTYALVAQGLIAASVTMILSWAFCPWKPTLEFNLRSVRSEISMGLDVLLFNLLNYAHRQADNLIIGHRWGAIELGLYSRAYSQMSQISSIIAGPLTNSLIPALSRVADNRDRWRNVFLNSASIVSTISGGLFSILWSIRSPLVALLFGKRWGGLTDIFGFLILAGLVTTVCSPFSWAFVTLGRTRLQLYWILFASPILVISFWFGASAGGLGVARAYAETIFVLNFVFVALALHRTPVTWKEGWSLKIGVYVAVGGVALGHYLSNGIMANLSVGAQIIGRTCLASGIYLIVMTGAAFVIPAHSGIRSVVSSVQSMVGLRLFRS